MDLLDLESQGRDDIPPARVNAVTMTLTGTGAWLAATAAVAVAQSQGVEVPDGWLDVCLAGIGLGGLGLIWATAHERRAGREDAER